VDNTLKVGYCFVRTLVRSTAMGEYPREPGSPGIVQEEKWNREAPFGHCPACGSLGIEEVPGIDCEGSYFRCSDESCRSNIVVEHGRRETDTTWYENKTPEHREQERAGTSWNWGRFTYEFCVAKDLV